MLRTLSILIALSALAGIGAVRSQHRAKTSEVRNRIPTIPRAKFAGLHVGMSEDSVFMIFRSIAVRRDTLHVDSLLVVESDSIRVLGQPAYVQVQILHHRARTIVINYHPLAGERYLNVRDQVDQYMTRLFGRGVEEIEETLTHHRWETEDGTMEVSHSDRYTRVFIRLGMPRV